MPDAPHHQPHPVFVSSSQRRGAGLASQFALILALLIIGGLLAVWRPWDATLNSTARTISVTGEAELTAEPDEYVFHPEYTFKNAKQEAALTAATTKTNEVVAQLKTLGVIDSKIKTDTSSGYRSYYDDTQETYYAYLTVTIDDKALAQKVQDYLLTTSPEGSVTPEADFSKAKRQQLTDQARDQATKDARAKADQSARNLGFTVAKVKSVSDSPGNNFFDGPISLNTGVAAVDDKASAPSSPIQQGENQLTYQVTVVYYIK